MEKNCRNHRRGELRMLVQGFWDGLSPDQAYLRQLLLEEGVVEYKEATQIVRRLDTADAKAVLAVVHADTDRKISLIEQVWLHAPPLLPPQAL